MDLSNCTSPWVCRVKSTNLSLNIRIFDSDVAASILDFQQSKKRNADDDDDYFDIIAHRFGKSEVVQDELEQYLKVPLLALSTQEALSFEKLELTCVG